MHRNRPVVLLTGFGPFPGAPLNASSLLAEAVAEAAHRAMPGYEFHAATLPTEWLAGPIEAERLLRRLNPVVTIHFGVSHRARGFVVETRARNARQPIADACGVAPPAACVAEDGPGEIAATLPTGLIVDRLRRRGLPAVLSRDAGGYLCNAVLYHSLDHARRSTGTAGIGRRGFVHIPDSLVRGRGTPTRRAMPCLLQWKEAVEGGMEIVAASALLAR